MERKTVEQILKGMRMLGGYRMTTVIWCSVIHYDKNHRKDWRLKKRCIDMMALSKYSQKPLPYPGGKTFSLPLTER